MHKVLRLHFDSLILARLLCTKRTKRHLLILKKKTSSIMQLQLLFHQPRPPSPHYPSLLTFSRMRPTTSRSLSHKTHDKKGTRSPGVMNQHTQRTPNLWKPLFSKRKGTHTHKVDRSSSYRLHDAKPHHHKHASKVKCM